MEQTSLATAEDTPDVLKARLKREWEALDALKHSGEIEDNIARAQMLTTYLEQRLTQRDIGQTVGISHVYIGHLLRYHRFLVATATKMPEWRFRTYWKAHANPEALRDLRGQDQELALVVYEQQIFQDIVEEHMKGEGRPPEQKQSKNQGSRQLAKRILAQFSDGKFHLLRDIATAVEVDMGVVGTICARIVKHGAYQTFGERRPAPPAQGSFAYRFVKGGKKKLDVTAFYAEVKPVLDDMENVINGHSVDFSQQAMKLAFAEFRKVIDRVAR